MADSLWEFASTRYRYAGVAELCLQLQDECDADVNMLLAGAWLGALGYRWQGLEIDRIVAACAQWRAVCLLPLRKIRRDLKHLAGAEGWYERLKALELEAERQQLHKMEALLPSRTTIADRLDEAPDNPLAAIEDNLRSYITTLPALAGAMPGTVAAQLARLLMPA